LPLEKLQSFLSDLDKPIQRIDDNISSIYEKLEGTVVSMAVELLLIHYSEKERATILRAC
jgi:hypothetical protein